MLNTIFFDLDDTLLDFTRAEAEALRQVLTESGLPAGDDVLRRYHDINAAQWVLLEEGKLTRAQVKLRRFELLFQELGMACDPRDVGARYEACLQTGGFLVPGALELLKTLAPRYALYAASNGAVAMQYSRLERAGLRPWLRGIFISEEVGFAKPSAAFFDACFAAIPGFSRETSLLVGDSLTADIQGGRNAGLRTCWFNPGKTPGRADIRPDYEIAALADLPALLETL